MDEWLENFVLCEKIMSEVLNEIGNPQEQVPPIEARKNAPEKTKNQEKQESGPPSACVKRKNEKDVKRGVKMVMKKTKENLRGAENDQNKLGLRCAKLISSFGLAWFGFA